MKIKSLAATISAIFLIGICGSVLNTSPVMALSSNQTSAEDRISMNSELRSQEQQRITDSVDSTVKDRLEQRENFMPHVLREN